MFTFLSIAICLALLLPSLGLIQRARAAAARRRWNESKIIEFDQMEAEFMGAANDFGKQTQAFIRSLEKLNSPSQTLPRPIPTSTKPIGPPKSKSTATRGAQPRPAVTSSPTSPPSQPEAPAKNPVPTSSQPEALERNLSPAAITPPAAQPKPAQPKPQPASPPIPIIPAPQKRSLWTRFSSAMQATKLATCQIFRPLVTLSRVFASFFSRSKPPTPLSLSKDVAIDRTKNRAA